MISNETAAFLWDAQQAGERIIRFTSGRSYEDYLEDEILRSAVERQFQIIGEAFNRLRRLDPATAAQLPDLAQIISFRNVLVHDYTAIRNDTVWDVIRDDLPRLQALLTELLRTGPDPQLPYRPEE